MSSEDVYQKEREFLNTVYAAYTLDDAPQTQTMRRLIARTFSPFIQGGCALELGCSDGYMTEILAAQVDTLHVVDASESFIAEASERALPNVSFFCNLFEEFDTETRYDYVFASFILEHVLEVGPVLATVRRLLKPGGRFFAVVPNARALSRQLALHMGLLPELTELTENDLKYGHRRVYDRVHFNRDLEAAGFHPVSQGGIMLKILADFQLDQLIGEGFLEDSHIDGLYKLGLEYPDLCGALFSICEVR
ncbi:MAG: class I SAM-dependent methyltransferase [Proteobacteria bacterium]|nr:class I SAM-dependent methyltransferase [Pseudomonadota bacterium]